MSQNDAQGPWGAQGGIFRLFSDYFGPFLANFFSPYFPPWGPIFGPPIIPILGIALWGAPPVHFTLVAVGDEKVHEIAGGPEMLDEAKELAPHVAHGYRKGGNCNGGNLIGAQGVEPVPFQSRPKGAQGGPGGAWGALGRMPGDP